jgi:glutamyl-tRNA synthetase
MTLPELTSSFDLRMLTHRRSILDPVKLEYINKRHLMLLAGTSDGLEGLAHRVCRDVKKAFPQR